MIMTPHQSFTELATLSIAIFAGRFSLALSQVTAPNADWFDRLTGPLGAFVAMGVGIWWLSNRNAKQDAKQEEARKIQEAKDEEHLQSRIENMRIMTAALESTKAILYQNSLLLERATKALENHTCVK